MAEIKIFSKWYLHKDIWGSFGDKYEGIFFTGVSMKNQAGSELTIKGEQYVLLNTQKYGLWSEKTSNCIGICEAGTGSEWISVGGPVKGSVVVVGN